MAAALGSALLAVVGPPPAAATNAPAPVDARRATPFAEHRPLSAADRRDLASLIRQRLASAPIVLGGRRRPSDSAAGPASDPARGSATDSASPQSAYVYHGPPYGPADLWHLFGTADAAAARTFGANLSGVPGPSSDSPLIAVVEAGNYPHTYDHLHKFRADQTLPACPAGSCITTVNQTGGSVLPGDTTNGAWIFETDLDVQVISSVCPQCRILIVAADDASAPNLDRAAQTAVAMGARWVSMSFGVQGDFSDDMMSGTSVFENPDVVFTGATGDGGSNGASWPSASPYVVATGGLTVRTSGSAVTATAWSGAGSGCATEPSHRMSAAQSGDAGAVEACGSMRGASDIAGVADPATGVLTYSTVNGKDDYFYGGGTSAAAPAIAALYALAGNSTDAGTIYLKQRSGNAAVTDVTAGSNSTGSCSSSRLCNAQPGWDGPTGIGMPTGVSLFADTEETTEIGSPSYAVRPLHLRRHVRAGRGGITVGLQVPVTTTTNADPPPNSGGSTGEGTGSSTGSGGSIGGGLLGGGGLLAPTSTGGSSAPTRARTVTSTARLDKVWFRGRALPAGVKLRGQAARNRAGRIVSWRAVVVGAARRAGHGTAQVTIYGAVGGHVVSVHVRLVWRVVAGRGRTAGMHRRG